MSATTARTLAGTTFRTSRLLDFPSRKELIAQTGHREDQWLLVALKELVDNALDACEDASITRVSCPAPNPMTDQAGRRRYEGPTLARQIVSQTRMATQAPRRPEFE